MKCTDDIDKEIRWYYGEAESAIGIKSCFGIVEGHSSSGVVSQWEIEMSNKLKDITRLRAFEFRLNQLSGRHKTILHATHEPFNFLPYTIRKVFGNESMLALLIVKRDDLEMLCNKVKLRTATDKDNSYLSRIRTEISKMYDEAKEAYKETNAKPKR